MMLFVFPEAVVGFRSELPDRTSETATLPDHCHSTCPGHFVVWTSSYHGHRIVLTCIIYSRDLKSSCHRNSVTSSCMIRRNARLRKEYLYRKGLEGKERVAYENKRKVRQALEGVLLQQSANFVKNKDF